MKNLISNVLFTISHIIAKNQISWFGAFREWLWNELEIRKMKRTINVNEKHLFRDVYMGRE